MAFTRKWSFGKKQMKYCMIWLSCCTNCLYFDTSACNGQSMKRRFRVANQCIFFTLVARVPCLSQSPDHTPFIAHLFRPKSRSYCTYTYTIAKYDKYVSWRLSHLFPCASSQFCTTTHALLAKRGCCAACKKSPGAITIDTRWTKRVQREDRASSRERRTDRWTKWGVGAQLNFWLHDLIWLWLSWCMYFIDTISAKQKCCSIR